MGSIIDLTSPLKQNTAEDDEFKGIPYDAEIIYLQNYDNFYSLMDRLNQRDTSGQKTHCLILVWPKRGKIFETSMEFGRLQGWAVRNNYEIALVIPDDPVKTSMAMEQGFQVFQNLKEAGTQKWAPNKKAVNIPLEIDRIRRLNVLKKDVESSEPARTPFGLRFVYFLLTILILSAAFYAVFPQARIDIYPYLTNKSVNMTIWTDSRLDAPTLAGGIPTTKKRLEITLTAVVPATGIVQMEPGLAVGEITIRNTCDRIYQADAGVRVGTSEQFEEGINFITLDDVFLEPGQSKKVRIEASAGGLDGNLPAGSIKFAEYPQSLCWDVLQEESTSGGSSGLYAAAAEADYRKAQETVDDQIQTAAFEQLAIDPEGADLLTLGEAQVSAVKSRQFFPEPGYASDTVTLHEKLEVIYDTVKKSDMDAVVRGQTARMQMEAADFIGYEILSGPVEENGVSTWSIKADYLVNELSTNAEALQILLRGKKVDQAHLILDSLEHVKTAEITLLPAVLNRLPFSAQNIRVNIHPALDVEED